MTGRRAVVGLSLLCALVFSALAVSSASAESTPTWVTCEKVVEPQIGTKGFSDEHCTKAASDKAVNFEHKEFLGTTDVEGSNTQLGAETKSTVSAVLHGVLSTIPVTITCKKVSSTGKATNTAGPPMTATGTATVKYSECETVIEATKKNCKVKEPIEAKANLTNVVEGAEMYVKATGSGTGEEFVSLSFENNGAEVCPKGITALNPYKVTGSAIGTVNGATLEFKEKEPHSTLKLGGNTAEITQIETVRKAVGGNPISVTTFEP
jgi:hypothetical protein